MLHDNNSLSIDEVAIIFKVNASAVQKHFNAPKKGVLRRMGPTSGCFWEVLINLLLYKIYPLNASPTNPIIPLSKKINNIIVQYIAHRHSLFTMFEMSYGITFY
jgi:hypothetical protein